MPGTTVTDDVVLIHSGEGGGGGTPSTPGGGGDGQPDSFPAGEVPQRTYVTGMTIALGGILMFFMAFVSAYIVRKGLSNARWIPLEVPRILWLNTAILIASSFTMSRSRSRFLARDDAGFRHWWGVTTILGVFFLAGQLLAWRQLVHSGWFLATNPSSSFFYVFTAAHGLHIVGGILALLSVAYRPLHRLTRATATEVVAMYWHFMDGLWVFLFLLLLLGR
jgi:cytochrome c oxidase subunit III